MFKNAWTLGSLFGIPVRIHWSFLLIILYVVVSSYTGGMPWSEILIEVIFLLAMFCCVVMHEFGHALAAKRFGVETEDIILLPIGGVARLRNMPEKPFQELIIALMGPVVNVLIAIILFVGLFSSRGISFLDLENFNTMSWSSFLPMLMIANIMLLIFNMIPAFPMDGGRVLRALLAMRLGKLNATKWASRIGQAICIVFIVIGIYYQYWNTVLIGVFIFMGALQEYRSVVTDASFKDVSVGQACRKIFRSLVEHVNVVQAYNELMNGAEKNFLVMNLEGEYSGTVTAKNIIQAFKQNPDLRIKEIMKKNIYRIPSESPLINVLHLLQQNQDLLLVTNENEVMGVLDSDSIQHYLQLHKIN